MSNPLLTIIVPTYNRPDYLRRLLTVLSRELLGLEADVVLIIGDNASVDETRAVIGEFMTVAPVQATVVRQEINSGPDRNFLACVYQSKSPYIWILGDDDLPRAGLIKALIPLLSSERPDLLQIGSEWRKQNIDNDPHKPVVELYPSVLDRLSFARSVNVWLTFISGMIVNRERYLQSFQTVPLEEFEGTYLIQLGWVLDILRGGDKFIVINAPHILATADNSSGYRAYKIFGANFANICARIFGRDHKITRMLVRRVIIYHLPQLIWNTRYSRVPGFSHESLSGAARTELREYMGYWLILEPIASFPILIARVVLIVNRVFMRALKYLDKHRE
jgi:glycosyltransferase involved in cell wall biosynthesis